MEAIITFESGIIRTFRRFIGVRLVLLILILLVYLLGNNLKIENSGLYLAMLLDVGLLMVYLSLPRLKALLKKAYLPVGIIWATLGPMIELQALFFQQMLIYDSTRTVEGEQNAVLIFQCILVLFIPLVIIGGQYSTHMVMLYCGLTFLFDGLLALIIFRTFSNGLPGTLLLPRIISTAFIRTVLFFFIGNLIANLMSIQREQHQQLAQANDRLAQYAATLEQLTISRERNRVARELHDVLAHTMSGVAVELEGVRALLRMDPDRAENLLGESLGAVREGLNETRRALLALRATPLEDLGLGLAVRNLTESIAGRSGLQTDVQIEKDIPDYPIEVQQSFYRVAQEALTNVVSHAQASRVQVCLTREGSALKLLIRDDGIGFDEKAMDLDQKYGLLGIRERVEMIHGQLSIVSQVGSGTEIVLVFEANPLEASLGS